MANIDERSEPDRHKGSLYELCRKRREKIKSELIHRQADAVNYRFVCRADLVSIWKDPALKKIFPRWDGAALERFREKYILTLSILVYIDFPLYDDEVGFRQLFENEIAHSWNDSHLPLKRGDPLHKWIQCRDRSAAAHFLDNQYTFIPYIIEEDDKGDVVEIDRRRPLPFDEEPEFEAGGAFGQIYKVKVAQYCFKSSPSHSNSDGPEILAYKKFSRERAYRTEVKNIARLRQSLGGHECIAEHIAAIIHSNDLYIFHTYTALGDLQILLAGGCKEVEVDDDDDDDEDEEGRMVEKYSFNSTFHSPARSLFVKQLEYIASALDYLHRQLPEMTQDEMFCAHMDLKPNNILVYPAKDPASPNVGKWVLSDFGIASFKEADQYHDSYTTVGQVIEQSTDFRGTGRLGTGTYGAPELFENLGPRKKNGTMCDIWSFGCIINEVFAFILPGLDGGADEAKASWSHFRQQRIIGTSTENYRNEYWFEPVRTDNGTDAQLKTSVKNWLENRPLHTNYIKENMEPTIDSSEDQLDTRWIDSMCELIQQVLRPKPDQRLKARDIQRGMRRIGNELQEFEETGALWPVDTSNSSPSSLNLGLSDGQPQLTLNRSNTRSRHKNSIVELETTLDSRKWNLERPSKSKVLAFDISPDTQDTAWLCKTPKGTELRVLRIGSDGAEMCMFTADPDSDHVGCDQCEQVKWKNVKWKHVSLANGYVLITGQMGVEKVGRMYHTRSGRRRSMPGDPIHIAGCWPAGCVKIVVSSKGFLAWERLDNPMEVCVWNGENEVITKRPFGKGKGINSIEFSANGRYLCGWTSGGGRNFVYMAEVLPNIGQPIECSIPMKRVSYREPLCWVTQDYPACMIQEAQYHDIYFLSWDSQASQSREDPEIGNPTLKDDGKWVFALGNDVVAMARKSWTARWGKSKLEVFCTRFHHHEPRNMLTSEDRQYLGTHYITGRTIKITIHQGEHTRSIVVCTSDREVIRYDLGVRQPPAPGLLQDSSSDTAA